MDKLKSADENKHDKGDRQRKRGGEDEKEKGRVREREKFAFEAFTM